MSTWEWNKDFFFSVKEKKNRLVWVKGVLWMLCNIFKNLLWQQIKFFWSFPFEKVKWPFIRLQVDVGFMVDHHYGNDSTPNQHQMRVRMRECVNIATWHRKKKPIKSEKKMNQIFFRRAMLIVGAFMRCWWSSSFFYWIREPWFVSCFVGWWMKREMFHFLAEKKKCVVLWNILWFRSREGLRFSSPNDTWRAMPTFKAALSNFSYTFPGFNQLQLKSLAMITRASNQTNINKVHLWNVKELSPVRHCHRLLLLSRSSLRMIIYYELGFLPFFHRDGSPVEEYQKKNTQEN